MSQFFKVGLAVLIISVFLSSCNASKPAIKELKSTKISNNANHFVGMLVLDPSTNDTLSSVNAKKYFTPASTTKIFTLYSALNLLPERIPVLKYIKRNDTLHFEGLGDPTQLHHYFKDSTSINFLKLHTNLVWHSKNYTGDLLGPGWAWEDFPYYFQVERGALPLYGNVVRIYQGRKRNVSPALFQTNVLDLKHSKNRDIEANTFYYASSRRDTLDVPFRTNSNLTKKLLERALGRPVQLKTEALEGENEILYGIATDSVAKRMMHESDNFLADQLLILASGILSDSLDTKKAREYVLTNFLSDLKQQPRWVDGSGLSRYNLFTPESMVHVLGKLYAEIPQKRLFALFPKWEAEEDKVSTTKPFIYAKSGSVGNNYSLNGFVLTNTGKVLIFSIMNNHFMKSSLEIRKDIQLKLEALRNSN